MKRSITAAAAILLSAICAYAQQWPDKPVRIIVPFAAGATPDIVARLVTERLQEQLGQTFIVENKPGASGNAGTDAVAKAAPDGATIGVSIGGPLAINTLLFAHLPYDPRKDLALITLLATQPSALAINASLGVNNVSELIEFDPAQSGQIQFWLYRHRIPFAAGHGGHRA
jgi:tripartite-type tricarboxylate transporter receptor subunit TctC